MTDLAVSANFSIDGQLFAADLAQQGSGLPIRSSPRPYTVEFAASDTNPAQMLRGLLRSKHNIVLVDRKVAALHFAESEAFSGLSVRLIDAIEPNKTVEEALAIVEFLAEQRATKSSEVFAIGGGIVQDLAAFSCAVLKRGIPWTFIPTTVLAQGDSGVGGKTALNHKGAKNIIALFSAPRRVLIHPAFARTLPSADIDSGLGEIFRLHITGGVHVWPWFLQDLVQFRAGDWSALERMLRRALAVKKAVVEFDEFELNHRRSMNYGHSIGHALEGAVDYQIPHGTAVAIGCLVENQLAVSEGLLSQSVADQILAVGRQIVPESCKKVFAAFEPDQLFDYLAQDKKAEGATLFFALIRGIGDMGFFGVDLGNPQKRASIVASVNRVRDQFA